MDTPRSNTDARGRAEGSREQQAKPKNKVSRCLLEADGTAPAVESLRVITTIAVRVNQFSWSERVGLCGVPESLC